VCNEYFSSGARDVSAPLQQLTVCVCRLFTANYRARGRYIIDYLALIATRRAFTACECKKVAAHFVLCSVLAESDALRKIKCSFTCYFYEDKF